MDIQRRGTTARYSDSVTYQQTIYLVEVPSIDTGDIQAQAENMLASVERQLVETGSDKSQLLMATIYLVDMADYAAFNHVWERWVPSGHAPVRACVQVSALANPGWRVEIALTAAVMQV